jgi:hypothetical protein
MVTITFQGFALSSLYGHNYTESTLQLRPDDTIGTSRLTFVTSGKSWIASFCLSFLFRFKNYPERGFPKLELKVDRNRFFCIYKKLNYVSSEAHYNELFS